MEDTPTKQAGNVKQVSTFRAKQQQVASLLGELREKMDESTSTQFTLAEMDGNVGSNIIYLVRDFSYTPEVHEGRYPEARIKELWKDASLEGLFRQKAEQLVDALNNMPPTSADMPHWHYGPCEYLPNGLPTLYVEGLTKDQAEAMLHKLGNQHFRLNDFAPYILSHLPEKSTLNAPEQDQVVGRLERLLHREDAPLAAPDSEVTLNQLEKPLSRSNSAPSFPL